MPAWGLFLLELLAGVAVDELLAFLVNQGVLPAWVLGEQKAALEDEQYLIQQLVQQTDVAVQHPSYGLNAIKTQVDRNAVDVTKLVAAINALSIQVSNLPTPPGEGDIAQAVWTYQIGGPTDVQAGFHLQRLDNMRSHFQGRVAFPLQSDPFLIVDAPWGAITD